MTGPATPSQAAPDPERLAVALHVTDLLHHVEPVLRHLPPDTFEVVAVGPEEPRTDLEARVRALGWHYRDVDTLDLSTPPYRWTLSNHPLVGWVGGTSVVSDLGEHHVRYSYALGKSAHNFADWNATYDLVLAFGPADAAHLRSFDATVVQAGYPRYDDVVVDPPDPRSLRLRLGLDPDRPTVAWLPTWHELSSIDRWTDVVAGLCRTHQVVVKPHPLTITDEPDRMARLRAAGLDAVVADGTDSAVLLGLADTVLCDYGGSAFGAIYLDRDLLLLDLDGAEHDTLTGPDSLDIQLRGFLTTLTPADDLAAAVDDGARREDQRLRRRSLRRELFAPHRGFAGRVAAEAVRHRELLRRA